MAIAWRGGYGQDARAVVAALAGVAALITFATIDASLPRSAIVWTLVALGLLSGLSSLWTIGSTSEAIRDGLAILGLAAVVLVAWAAPIQNWVPGALLLAAATGVALSGVVAAITRSDPLALQICGSWRPAGPFEYPPALGLVCAGALPLALTVAAGEWRVAGGRGVRIGGALIAWLLATSVALTANRTAIALAAATLVVTVWLASCWPRLVPIALALIASAAGSALLIGSHLGDADAGRLLAAGAFALVPIVAALRQRSTPADDRAGHGTWIAVVAVAAVAATAGGVIADKGTGCQGDASHGRVGIWRAAVKTARDRPLQGYGSGTFLQASRAHQLEERPRPTRFAHNLVLEAWVELGIAGAALVIPWIVATLALAWRTRRLQGAYLLIPYAVAFPLANLLDWPWHLLGAGVLWAIAAGVLLRSESNRAGGHMLST